ncbi:hypothetical protein NDU88_004093 [Pleurodeles waltl]|uniref:Nudix hydrolase domain-containing protein n=1 Tax=Pleurodeles waltl TaxID=8319 RepID=A0AAV7T7T0_PLEWA|nr:hypothetical protein NDU88_004093 [Pleurodeles waltl]
MSMRTQVHWYDNKKEAQTWIEAQPAQASRGTLDSRTPHTKRSKHRKGRLPGGQPSAEEARQAWSQALEDVAAFQPGVPASPVSQREVSEELGVDDVSVSSNVTARSGHSDLSDSEQELPIVTAPTANDLTRG